MHVYMAKSCSYDQHLLMHAVLVLGSEVLKAPRQIPPEGVQQNLWENTDMSMDLIQQAALQKRMRFYRLSW